MLEFSHRNPWSIFHDAFSEIVQKKRGTFGKGTKRYKIELWQAICMRFPGLLETVPSSATNTGLASIIHVAHSACKKKKKIPLPPMSCTFFFLSVIIMFSLLHLYLQSVPHLFHRNASFDIHCFRSPLSCSIYSTTLGLLRGRTEQREAKCPHGCSGHNSIDYDKYKGEAQRLPLKLSGGSGTSHISSSLLFYTKRKMIGSDI